MVNTKNYILKKLNSKQHIKFNENEILNKLRNIRVIDLYLYYNEW